MPRYRVTLSDGRIVTVEAATQPTEAQVIALLMPAHATPTAPDTGAAGALAGLSKASGIGAGPSRAEDAIRQLRDLGAFETVGGLAGGAITTPTPMGPIPGAMGGAALARFLRGQFEGEPASTEDLLWAAGPEAIPGGGKALKATGRFLGNAALKPGLRVVNPATEEVITGTGRSISSRFPEVDVVGEVLERGRPIRNAGLVETQEHLGVARKRALDAVEAFAASRPKVAGLLPEGRVDMPLGDAPVPSGGRAATPLADVSQFRRQSESTKLQGMDPDDPLDPIFGGGPRAEPPMPLADSVTGPGTIRRTLSEAGIRPPPTPLIPGQSQMVGVEEALAPALDKLAGMSRTALPARKRALAKQIEEYAAEYPDPADVKLAQLRKDVSADEAANIYRANKGMADDEGAAVAQFHEMLAKGNRQAVEARVPNIRALNTETQTELAIRDALREALDKEARSSRFTLSGLIDNPRLLGAAARVPYRLGGPLASRFSPATLRLLEGLMSSHDQPPRRQLAP